jgi:hypothetical protein
VKEAPPALSKKLSKLIPLLASDKEGEVVATARAIIDALTKEGFDLHDLASSLRVGSDLSNGISYGPVAVSPNFDELSNFKRRAWLAALSKLDWLTALERETVQDVNNRVIVGIDFHLDSKRKRRINEPLARASAMGVRA